MKPLDIVRQIREENPKLLARLPDQKVARIILAALAQLRKQIEDEDEGLLRVPGFGNFRFRQVVREKDGKRESVKRIIFRPAKPR